MVSETNTERTVLEDKIIKTLTSPVKQGSYNGEPSDETENVEEASLSPIDASARRLAKKPSIGHLEDGVAVLEDDTVVPLFEEGGKIVAERYTNLLKGEPWLDTRVYLVRSIDDANGLVHCTDVEFDHYACIGFRHPLTTIKLCPDKGDPFRISKKGPRVVDEVSNGDATKKRRGRPMGSKNRPKDVIKAEKKAKKSK